MSPGQLAIALAVVFAVNLLRLGGLRPGERPRGRLWGSPDGSTDPGS